MGFVNIKRGVAFGNVVNIFILYVFRGLTLGLGIIWYHGGIYPYTGANVFWGDYGAFCNRLFAIGVFYMVVGTYTFKGNCNGYLDFNALDRGGF